MSGSLTHEVVMDIVASILTSLVTPATIQATIPASVLVDLCDQVDALLAAEPAQLELHGPLVVVGDIHGNIDCLARILGKFGWPPMTRYLFMGDYVDRGSHSCAVLILLYALKLLYPHKIHLLRGNHECRELTDIYGFRRECLQKYSIRLYEAAVQSFENMPIAAVANSWFCVHGGIAPGLMSGGVTAKDSEVVPDLLWSDPCDEVAEFEPNPRGCGVLFGEAAAARFLDTCGLRGIIRAHQACQHGVDWPFLDQGRVVTVFSTYDYCESMNDAAILLMDAEGNIKVEVIAPVLPQRRSNIIFIWPTWLLSESPRMPIALDRVNLEIDPGPAITV
jgi:serine/threonine-protein phosphatase PP1 catalytic subunit